MSYNTDLQSNNEELQEILKAVNELPENGTSVSNAVLYVEQALTPEQQAQARQNIGVTGTGKDGESPIITLSEFSDSTGSGVDIEVKNPDGSGQIYPVYNGKDGTNGNDGVSPTVAVSKSGKVTTISITDKNGTKTATINDGEDGDTGEATVTADSVKNALGYTPADRDKAFIIKQEITPDYINQIDIYGCEVGKHMDSTGELIDSANTCVSGFIPVKQGDVIRIKDTSQSKFNNTLMMALFGEDKAETSGIGRSVTHILTADSNNHGVATIEGNVMTWTLDPINYWYWKNFAYLRVSTLSANMIVTINEPITESVKESYGLKPEVLGTEISGKPLAGKTVVGFGDSIFGYVRDSTSVLSYVAEETGATVHNVGFGGCRMSVHPTSGYAAFSMWALAKAITENNWTTQDAQAASGSDYFPAQLALLKSIDFSKVDIAIIHYGSNDFTGSAQVDNASDHDDYTTLCGALRYSVEKLLTAYPSLQIYVSLPAYFYKPDTGKYPDTYTNGLNKYCYEYIDALRKTAEEYNLPVIDCFYGMGVNKLNIAALTSDGAHHNAIGRKRLGEFIAGHLSSRQASAKSGMDTAAVQSMIDSAIGSAIGGAY